MRQLSAVALLTLFSVAACGGDNNQEGEAMTADTAMTETAQPGQAAMDTAPAFVATIQSAQDTGHVTGTVRVYAEGSAAMQADTENGGGAGTAPSAGNGFRLVVSVNGLSQGEHAWHIHSGPCGQPAPVDVAITTTADQQGIGQPLTADQSGNAMGSVTVPASRLTFDQLQGGQYSLHIHQQGGVDHGPTVACADLSETGSGMTTGS